MSRTVTLKGNPLPVAGPELKIGDKAPDAVLKSDLVNAVSLGSTNGKKRIFSVVPSLDTSICAMQTRRFYEEATNLPDVQIFTISTDLPMAQSRFCAMEGLKADNAQTLSDHFQTSFGQAYGVLVPSLRILQRAVFVVDADGVIRHAEYVPDIASHPNYDAALDVVKKI